MFTNQYLDIFGISSNGIHETYRYSLSNQKIIIDGIIAKKLVINICIVENSSIYCQDIYLVTGNIMNINSGIIVKLTLNCNICYDSIYYILAKRANSIIYDAIDITNIKITNTDAKYFEALLVEKERIIAECFEFTRIERLRIISERSNAGCIERVRIRDKKFEAARIKAELIQLACKVEHVKV